MAIKKDTLHAKGLEISIYTENFEDEYISLTDIAKYRNADDPRFIIQNWMRSRDVIDFLGIWECLHNPDFNRVKFEAVKNEAGYNRFVMTPTKWIEQTSSMWHFSDVQLVSGERPTRTRKVTFATMLPYSSCSYPPIWRATTPSSSPKDLHNHSVCKPCETCP